MASLLAHGVRLPLVLGNAGVDGPVFSPSAPVVEVSSSQGGNFVLDNVRADGSLEHLREGVSLLAGLAIGSDDGDNRPARHFVCCAGFLGLVPS